MTRPSAAEYAAGLRQLADFIEANPDLPAPVYLRDPSVWSLHNAEETRAVGFAALRAGATVKKDYGETLMRLEIGFGPVTAVGLVYRDEVCERVLVGTETVTEDEPDPDAPLVTIPDPTVTRQVQRTVDKYEWRCAP